MKTHWRQFHFSSAIDMKIRFLLIPVILGCQLAAWAQTCRQNCDADCRSSFTDSRRITQCRLDCYKRNCGTGNGGGGGTNIPPRPWDVIASKDRLDGNGFFRNPIWSWAAAGGPLKDVCDSCPCTTGITADREVPLSTWLQTPACTRQATHAQFAPICAIKAFSIDSGLPYHINWFPVEYEGPLAWEDHSDWTTDNEYSFNILRPDLALVARDREDKGVHLEFTSPETVDEWDNTGTWWENFHHNIVDKFDQAGIRSALGNPFTIVIGMLGLDMAHINHHAELHPVYAMFIRIPQGLFVDRWAFFIRNWGTEGFCGPNDEPLPDYPVLQVKLPDHVLLSQNVWGYSHGGDVDACNSQTGASIDPNGLLTFKLGSAVGKCGIVGDLTMQAERVSTAPTSTTPAPAPAAVEEQEGNPLKARIAKLNPAERQELNNQLAVQLNGARIRPVVRRLQIQKLSQPISSGNPPPVTAKKFQAVPDPAAQAREAKRQQLIDAFLKAHGI
jgi:hypothetical protein